jgi:glucosamine-6-phosphate deaminase
MKLIKVKNYPELSRIAAELIISEISKKPGCVLGFATGQSPLGLYKNLVGAYNKRKVDFSKVKSFNLDEYYPIRKSDKNSFYYYMHKNLFEKINIKKENINFLNGEAKDPAKECSRYEKMLKKHDLDLQILGVGVNGHIGFDEPGSRVNSKTRLVSLTDKTRKYNSRHFKNERVPRQALTMGIRNILNSKKIILLASGNAKKESIKHLLEGKVSGKWPVTYLKKHKGLVLIADKKALG